MKIGIVSDHRGVDIKSKIIKYLEKEGYQVINYGTNDYTSVDFPTYAFLLGDKLNNKEVDFGIAICGTGIGMSIALNKVKGIMCAKIDNPNDAMYAKMHNNANCIALSANKSFNQIKKMLKTFLNTSFSKDEKYQRRINLIKDKEATK